MRTGRTGALPAFGIGYSPENKVWWLKRGGNTSTRIWLRYRMFPNSPNFGFYSIRCFGKILKISNYSISKSLFSLVIARSAFPLSSLSRVTNRLPMMQPAACDAAASYVCRLDMPKPIMRGLRRFISSIRLKYSCF